MEQRRNSILDFSLLRSLLVVGLATTGLLLSCPPVVAESPRGPAGRDQNARETVRTATIHWENVPLRDAIERLSGALEAPVFLDRRLDPSQRIRLQIKDATLEDILLQLAAENGWRMSRLPSASTYYLGPATSAKELSRLAALRRGEVSALPLTERQSLEDKRSMRWSRLTSPRDSVVAAVRERGWRVRGEAAIPHDLWPAGQLPDVALADGVTLLLIGFDLTFRVEPSERVIEIVPLEGAGMSDGAPAGTTGLLATAVQIPSAGNRPRTATATAKTKQVYTLRVEEQPVGVVLRQLAERLNWRLKIDEKALEAAGLSLDRRVSFAVQNADEEQLLEALLAPAHLAFQRHGEQLTIVPETAAANRN